MNFFLLLKRFGLSRRGSKLLLFYGIASLAFITYGFFMYGVDETTFPILMIFAIGTFLLLAISVFMLIYVKGDEEIIKENKQPTAIFVLKSMFASLVVGFIIYLPSHFIVEFMFGHDVAKFMTDNMHETVALIAVIAFPFVYKKIE